MSATPKKEVATCRSCRSELRGEPYYKGGVAYLPLPKGGRAPINYYGGYVCSRRCDVRACRELEQSMPGHGLSQTRIDVEAQRRVDANWPEALS